MNTKQDAASITIKGSLQTVGEGENMDEMMHQRIEHDKKSYSEDLKHRTLAKEVTW